jgi:hypothetical protein
MRGPRPLEVIVTVMMWLPVLGLVALAGVIFGWRAPFVLAVALGVVFARARRLDKQVGKLRATAEFVFFAFLGAFLGEFGFGGLGAIFGFVVGFTFRLAEVPVTGGPSFRRLRR